MKLIYHIKFGYITSNPKTLNIVIWIIIHWNFHLIIVFPLLKITDTNAEPFTSCRKSNSSQHIQTYDKNRRDFKVTEASLRQITKTTTFVNVHVFIQAFQRCDRSHDWCRTSPCILLCYIRAFKTSDVYCFATVQPSELRCVNETKTTLNHCLWIIFLVNFSCFWCNRYSNSWCYIKSNRSDKTTTTDV